jgi:hypothetical protein
MSLISPVHVLVAAGGLDTTPSPAYNATRCLPMRWIRL